ncbi:MAG: hypothetical protein KKD31_12235 [Bacteroidetes bacterium]|nr:hypothetical protein [Bacteroidota bacterium]
MKKDQFLDKILTVINRTSASAYYAVIALLLSENLHFYLAKKYRRYTYNYVDLGTEIDEIFSSFNIALERIDQYGKTE